MPRRLTSRAVATLAVAGAIALAGLLTGAAPRTALAFGDEPAPKIDCKKRENRNKPACKAALLPVAPTTDEIYLAAYNLARAGQYAAALDVLKLGDPSDPRILTTTGFAMRKGGDVEGALTFYRRALELSPRYVQARAYMGEAFLTLGKAALARAELAEIERLAGRASAEYQDLAMAIAAHDAAGRG